jgi:2'-5' RNA ligase superfamily
VPEAEAIAGSWREQYATDAAHGMWLHVTLIYPFRDSSQIDAKTWHEITRALQPFRRFGFRLVGTAYFPGPPPVLYLVPEPSAPFVEMTQGLAAAFPDTPPYGGAHEEIIPHVSVADSDDLELLAEIEADVNHGLPLAATAREVELLVHEPAGWRRKTALGLEP